MITILEPGPYCSIQDLGRRGYGRWGISPGGAADRRSHSLANRLVGNFEGAATLELTFGPVRLHFDESAIIAVTGAAEVLTVIGGGAPNGPFRVGPGEVRVHAPVRGVRSYVAVRGGIDTPLILGSRSTDPSSGFGAVLHAGDIVPVGHYAIVSDIIVGHAPTRTLVLRSIGLRRRRSRSSGRRPISSVLIRTASACVCMENRSCEAILKR